MLTAFAALLVVHGLIHLLGVAKAFGWAELSQLTRPISPAMGVVWLVSALLLLATAFALFTWPRWWWALGACAVVASSAAVISSWSDAKAGMIANVVIAIGLLLLGRGR